MLLRLLGQQFLYNVHCNIGGNSRVLENNGLVSMPFALMELNTCLQAAAELATRKSVLFDETMTNWWNWTLRDVWGNWSLDPAVTAQ